MRYILTKIGLLIRNDNQEGKTFGKQVKSFEAPMTEEKMRTLTPSELDLRYHMLGEQIAGKVWYLKAWKETEAVQGFVHANHPIRKHKLS